jgi:hypothetical protein
LVTHPVPALQGLPQVRESKRKAAQEMSRASAITSYCRTILIPAISLVIISCATNQPTPSGNGPTMAANELAATSQLRAIASAEATYQATTGGGGYGTLKQLTDSQYLSQQISTGENRGYRFVVRVSSDSSYETVATPLQYGFTGLKSFYMNSSSSTIHAADKKGAEATASDPEL